MSDLPRRHGHRHAGRSGLKLADDDLRRWRREHRPFFWTVTVTVSVLVIGSFVALFFGRSLLSWTAGLVTGMSICFLLVVRETGPAWIENRRRGAWAEQRTAKELAPLTRRGWVVLHDLPSSHGNLDHVAIGPPGVFVLDTKQRAGAVLVDGDDLVVTSPSGGRTWRDRRGSNARAQGRELHRRLRAAGADLRWVDAVVVVWADFPARVTRGNCWTAVAGEAVVGWLEEQPPRYTPKQVETLAVIARTLVEPTAGGVADVRAA